MLVTILATVFILAIAVFQARQGLFSALIMTVLTVLCAAVALNLYPAVGELLLYSRQGAFADAVGLTAVFILSLLVLRLIFDWLIAGNAVLGFWPDRIGGLVLGGVSGMILVGVLLVIMQMLPFGPSVLGYRPYDDALQRDQKLWPFCPDDFAVAVARAVSAGALNSPNGFDKVHDEFLLECFAARNTAGKDGGVNATSNALGAVTAYEPPAEAKGPKAAPPPATAGAGSAPAEPDRWVRQVPKDPRAPKDAPTRVLVLRVPVGETATDADGTMRLAGTHFRLVGTSGRSYYPLGFLTPDPDSEAFKPTFAPAEGGQTQPARLFVEHKLAKGGTAITLDWVYRIEKQDQPSYLVFRRVARQAVPKPRLALPPLPPRETKPAAPAPGPATKRR